MEPSEVDQTVGPRKTIGPFGVQGIDHLALVCQDMKATVAFYEGLLGMPLVKTIELGDGGGQHFFFDAGGGNQLAFFWFSDGPKVAPGIAMPTDRPDRGNIQSAHGSMNHVAFQVQPETIDNLVGRLRSAGVECSEVVNHDDSARGVSRDVHDGVFVRSIYFTDPDGIQLEFAAWTRGLNSEDIAHEPARASRP
tara:strand:- start:527 stop:1108 length:582 start_codon:yes stop_codon:yes gene_type:complete